MISVTSYEPWHYEYVANQTGNTKLFGEVAIRLFAFAHSLRGAAYTFKKNSQVIGCGGMIELWPGVGEAWSLISDEARQPFFLHRWARKTIRDIAGRRHYHRVQAIVKKDDARAVQWIERLDFYPESVLRKFGSDRSDFIMYVWRQSEC